MIGGVVSVLGLGLLVSSLRTSSQPSMADIVYWTFLLTCFGFWVAVRREPTLLPEEPDWLEALVSAYWFVGGLASVIWAIKKARERRTDEACVNEHANTP
ncbi:hypothetical protein OO015_11440 [Thermomicrobium sp. 4228-Ro]|uniref:hypothetical protein n=1 Tax=Thermomicrobium sp. 4228-Ro TaxID=2993937 RepID=UPI002248C075|nr:hypothetical protein [Thermomicrobium sp. 4228-Ro]MCX2728103.1 hypothetical protein [Thermomicrobium sp. 4228-Ro]